MIATATWIATALLSMAVLLGIARLISARDPATRAIIGDLVFFSCVGILLARGMVTNSSVWIDLSVIAALLGIVATIALARILTRGRR